MISRFLNLSNDFLQGFIFTQPWKLPMPIKGKALLILQKIPCIVSWRWFKLTRCVLLQSLHPESYYIILYSWSTSASYTDSVWVSNSTHSTKSKLSGLSCKNLFTVCTAIFAANPTGKLYTPVDMHGRMPQSVRERYLKMKETPDHPANLDVLIQNFDCALSHPDANDLEKLK